MEPDELDLPDEPDVLDDDTGEMEAIDIEDYDEDDNFAPEVPPAPEPEPELAPELEPEQAAAPEDDDEDHDDWDEWEDWGR